MTKVTNVIILMILLFAVVSSASAADNVTLYFQPHNTTSDNTTVELWLDIPAGLQVSHGQIGVEYDPLCGDIIARNFNAVYPDGIDPSWSFWNSTGSPNCWDDNTDWVVFKFFTARDGPIHALVGDFTIHYNSTEYCINHLNFSYEPDCVQGATLLWNSSALQVAHNTSNTTIEYGTPSPPESFIKPLYEGWNLISLPLDPEDSSASEVLSTVVYSAAYQYNAESKTFESIDSSDAMNPGTGYFVYVTEDCTWDYSGYAYTSMDLSLEQGLNMVGWLNCSKDIDDALSLISDDCRYVARWDTSTQKFEVCNPLAPSGFNDITTMDRGTGYFISAKQSCTLSEEC